ncbi:MAG: ABC transporter ATP-binding protein [Polyangiales bacterium]
MLGIAAASAGLAWLGGPVLVALVGATAKATAGTALPTNGSLPRPSELTAPMVDLVDSTTPLSQLVAGLAVLAALRGLAQFVQAASTERLQQGAMARTRTMLVARLLGARAAAVLGLAPAEVATRVSSDVQRIDSLVGGGVLGALTHVLTLGVLGAFAVTLDPWLAGMALLSLPPMAMLGFWLSKRARRAGERALRAHADFARHVAEATSALPTVQAYRAESWVQAKLDGTAAALRVRMMAATRARAVLGPAIGFAGALAFAGILLVAGERLAHGTLRTADAGSLFAALLLMVRPVTALGTLAGTLAQGFAALDRLSNLMERLEPRTTAGVDTGTSHAFESLRVERANVVLGEKTVLEGIDLELRRGEVLALVGANGAGKTTLVELMLGLVTPNGGGVHLNGKPYADWHAADLARMFAWVSEEPALFEDTVRANILLSDEGEDAARLDRAIHEAGLHAFVGRLSDGLNTRLVHAGRDLSLGERQRIALARALYRRAPVLVFDEPTAHLDGETASALARTLDTLLENHTVVIVSHRPSTIARATRVCVIDGGRIVAEGTPAQLQSESLEFRALLAEAS